MGEVVHQGGASVRGQHLGPNELEHSLWPHERGGASTAATTAERDKATVAFPMRGKGVLGESTHPDGAKAHDLLAWGLPEGRGCRQPHLTTHGTARHGMRTTRDSLSSEQPRCEGGGEEWCSGQITQKYAPHHPHPTLSHWTHAQQTQLQLPTLSPTVHPSPSSTLS